MDRGPIVPDTRTGQGPLSTTLALHDLLTHYGLNVAPLPATDHLTSAEVLTLATQLHTATAHLTPPGLHLPRLKLEGLAAQCAFELHTQSHLAT